MRVRKAVAAAALAGVSLLLMSGVAEGGTIAYYHLVADPTHGLPGTAITLTGTPAGNNAPCDGDSYTITGTYAKSGGGTGTQNLSGTTSASGTISSNTIVPADAAPGGTVTYQATITSCSAQDGLRESSDTAIVTVDQPATTTTSTTTTPATTTTTALSTTTTAPGTTTTIKVAVSGAAPPATPVRAQPKLTG